MRKKLLQLIFLLCFTLSLNAQNDCTIPVLTDTFQNEELLVKVGLGGGIWRQPYVITPPPIPDLEVYPLFAGGLWIAGKTPDGEIRMATSQYGDWSGNFDYFTGPIYDEGFTDAELCANMEQFWPITQADIDLFLEDFSDGTIDDTHTNVFRWPAIGNPNFEAIFGFQLPNQQLAPFIDQNGDGIYNPADGDYPQMKGDQALWWVFNDLGGEHLESFTEPIGAEVQVMLYHFSGQSENLDNSLFYDFKIINKGDSPLDSFYTSLFFDYDLGCHTDDYVGCYPEEDLSFVYNQDELDGTTACQCEFGINTYCNSIPVFGTKLLNSPEDEFGEPLGMTSYNYFNNSGIGGPPTGTYDPNGPQEIFNYMKGLWRDGTPITEGGDGYMEGEVTKFALPGNPADPEAWSMASANFPPGDRRSVMNCGPVNLDIGESLEYTYVFLFTPNVPHPNPDIQSLIDAGMEAEALFNSITSVEDQELQNQEINLFPNPARDIISLSLKNNIDQIKSIQIFNTQGQLIHANDQLFQTQLELDVSTYSNGIYWVKLETESGYWHNQKFLIQ